MVKNEDFTAIEISSPQKFTWERFFESISKPCVPKKKGVEKSVPDTEKIETIQESPKDIAGKI